MTHPTLTAALVVALALGACSKSPESPPAVVQSALMPVAALPATLAAHDSAENAIAWEKGDVDAAFAKARATGRPLFLYWGATWCPPCNEVKATLFNRQDFIERSRNFVPVYIDGDAKNAQKLGTRFNVSGYPTMVLFTPNGAEITRLPGEVDADRYMQVLALGMNGAKPVIETLRKATGKGGSSGLTADDWRMLAWYSWDTDESQLLAPAAREATLNALAKACPASEPQLATRLSLQAMVAGARVKGAKPRNDVSATRAVTAVLHDANAARENFDLVVYNADTIAGHITLAKSAERVALLAAWNATLAQLADSPKLAEADRQAALYAQVSLVKLDGDKATVPTALQQQIKVAVARADAATHDPYARQALISDGAELLAKADLLAESDALLTKELKLSHSPYYAMMGLADNAETRGDKAGALEWAEKAYTTSTGPATRLQWGSRYVRMMTELSPQDSARIEKAAAQIIGELDPVPDTFYGRNQRALARVGQNLNQWNKGNRHADALARLKSGMDGVCKQLPAADPAHATCNRTFAPTTAARTA